MPASDIHDTTATKPSAHSASHLPGLVQLLAWQHVGKADNTCHSFEERVTLEPRDIVASESILGGSGE